MSVLIYMTDVSFWRFCITSVIILECMTEVFSFISQSFIWNHFVSRLILFIISICSPVAQAFISSPACLFFDNCSVILNRMFCLFRMIGSNISLINYKFSPKSASKLGLRLAFLNGFPVCHVSFPWSWFDTVMYIASKFL